jgi:hypothetical protein
MESVMVLPLSAMMVTFVLVILREWILVTWLLDSVSIPTTVILVTIMMDAPLMMFVLEEPVTELPESVPMEMSVRVIPLQESIPA